LSGKNLSGKVLSRTLFQRFLRRNGCAKHRHFAFFDVEGLKRGNGRGQGAAVALFCVANARKKGRYSFRPPALSAGGKNNRRQAHPAAGCRALTSAVLRSLPCQKKWDCSTVSAEQSLQKFLEKGVRGKGPFAKGLFPVISSCDLTSSGSRAG